jgi:CRP-like cAMP-binding protein
MQTLKPILEAHPFLQGLEPRHLDLLVGCASNVRFTSDEILFRQGERADQFYIVREGRVALDIHAPGPGTITILTLEQGDVLGWSWLIPPYRWHFDARALTPVRAIALDASCLRTKCEDDHDLGYEFLKRFSDIIVKRLLATQLQLLDMYGDRAIHREGNARAGGAHVGGIGRTLR